MPDARAPLVVGALAALTYELTVDLVAQLDVLDAVSEHAPQQQVPRLRAQLAAHVPADIL